MNLIDVHKAFGTEEQCLAYLEQMRWPNGVRCVTCGSKDISSITRKSKKENKRETIYQCLEESCKQQFSATSGTIFHDTHLPLQTWFIAVALVTNAKKGISALQLQRDLGVGSYRTAWYLYHRIREAMKQSGDTLTGIVEVDETYIGGKQRGHKAKRTNKDVVIGLRQRGGPLRLVHAKNAQQETVYNIIAENVGTDVEAIMTDDSRIYNFDLTAYRGKHKSINHSRGQYVRGGDIHTNTVENAFSLLKRGIIGNFHRVSIKHLQRYLDEFGYRFDARDISDLFRRTVARLTAGKAIQYKQLTGEAAT